MSNSRLYIRNKLTGEQMLLAKHLGRGWFIPESFSEESLSSWLSDNDLSGGWGQEAQPTDLELITEYDEDFAPKVGT